MMTLCPERRVLRHISACVSAAIAGAIGLTAPTIAMAASVSPAAGPATVKPAALSAKAGYIWADGGSASGYYSYNSADAGSYSVSPIATGEYSVTFDGLGSIATHTIVQVTPVDSSASCVVGGWSAVSTSLTATIFCYDPGNGSAVDADFEVLVTHPVAKPRGTFDYAYVYEPTGTLTSTDEYNSAGRKTSVRHLSKGNYQVTFGGPKSSGTSGTVKVTPYGSSAGVCDPVSWHGSAHGEIVDIRCSGPGNIAENRDFLVTYAATDNLMALNSGTDANLLAAGSRTVYQPAVQYDSHHRARATVAHVYTGGYEVLPAGSAGDMVYGGDVQVSAVSKTGVNCVSSGWDEQLTPELFVSCYNGHGSLVNSPFTLQWVVP
jgi:hypothetical protein